MVVGQDWYLAVLKSFFFRTAKKTTLVAISSLRNAALSRHSPFQGSLRVIYELVGMLRVQQGLWRATVGLDSDRAFALTVAMRDFPAARCKLPSIWPRHITIYLPSLGDGECLN